MVHKYMVRLRLPQQQFHFFDRKAFLHYVSNFPKETFMYAQSHSETDHISVISWYLMGQTINSLMQNSHLKA